MALASRDQPDKPTRINQPDHRNNATEITPWDYWLQESQSLCPHLEDLTHKISKIRVLKSIGQGGHSRVVKVEIDGRIYALKLYSWTCTEPWIYTKKGFRYMIPRADPFVVECRAYNNLVAKELNGVATPHCYGWLSLDKALEETLQKRFWVPFAWDRPRESANEPVHGLLLEYLQGVTIDKARLTPEIAESFRDGLKTIHNASVLHNDLKPLNMIVTRQKRAVWIDFSVSMIPPYMLVSEESYRKMQETETILVEYFFTQLEKLPQNQGTVLTTANMEELLGGPVPEWWFLRYGFKLIFHERGMNITVPEKG